MKTLFRQTEDMLKVANTVVDGANLLLEVSNSVQGCPVHDIFPGPSVHSAPRAKPAARGSPQYASKQGSSCSDKLGRGEIKHQVAVNVIPDSRARI